MGRCILLHLFFGDLSREPDCWLYLRGAALAEQGIQVYRHIVLGNCLFDVCYPYNI
jgi:hypothetical protein